MESIFRFHPPHHRPQDVSLASLRPHGGSLPTLSSWPSFPPQGVCVWRSLHNCSLYLEVSSLTSPNGRFFLPVGAPEKPSLSTLANLAPHHHVPVYFIFFLSCLAISEFSIHLWCVQFLLLFANTHLCLTQSFMKAIICLILITENGEKQLFNKMQLTWRHVRPTESLSRSSSLEICILNSFLDDPKAQ